MKHEPTSQESVPSGLIGWFIENHVAANILMLLFVVGGIITVLNMRTETFPSIDPRLVTVSVVYPGASPNEIADSITNRVEEGLVGIEGVKRVTSTANEGFGVINVQLEDFANADDVYNDVETSVNSLIDFPPEDAERAIIKKVRLTPTVITLAVHGDASEYTLKYWAETIEDELRQLPGVALTELRGIRKYQISIEVPETTLRQYGLSLESISNIIRQFSEDIPAGTIEARQGDILLRVQEKRYTGREFEDIVVRTLADGSSLRLGDIAQIKDGFEDINLISKFNNERSAFIDVKRSESEDTLAVADAVKKYLQTIQLPTGLKLTLQKDETVNLKDRISLMVRNGILGFMLVFLILLLFLDLKLAFWTSAAIPISFLGGLMIIGNLGQSLNMISLFALIVVLGIVVDDGIVTGESIFESQEKYKNDPHSSFRGVIAVLAPVTIGVTTTMAAFGPLIFSTGTLGQIISVIPVVVISILFVSLLEAYFILPAHLSSPSRWSKGIMATMRDRFALSLANFTDNKLMPFSRFAMRWRYATFAAFIGIGIFTLGLVQSGTIRFVFFPQIEGDTITITVKMPLGTPFEITQSTMLSIEGHLLTVRDEIDGQSQTSAFESISVSIGQISGASGPGGGLGGESASHIGQFKVQLVPSDYRTQSSADIEGLIRGRIQDLPGIETLEFQSSLIGEDADIEIELAHPDEVQLNAAAELLKQEMEKIPGTKEVTDTFELGKPEYIFKLNAEGLAVGLTPSELGRQLRSSYFGLEAQRFQRGRSEMIVYVRYPKDERESISSLNRTRIRLQNGEEVPLGNVATIIEQRGYSQIRTVNGRRIVSVTGDADIAVTTPNEIIATLENDVLPEIISRYQGLSYSFEGESREQNEDLASLARNTLIALMLIYVLLGAQLRSYVQPFIIMTAIPFGIVGAILGHLVLGYDLTFISMFGGVALTGVVVNDSVVLVDYLNKHHRDGISLGESALIAVKRRFRPILLTTLSTSLGLLPILLETSMQARFLIPMVVSLATGILFSTIVILILVPCLVLIVEDVKELGRRVFSMQSKDIKVN
jgi:multidrug efflux pump subunit AcrB